MRERRQRQRYSFPGWWVRWEHWSFWSSFTGGRIGSATEGLEEVDELIDLAPGGVAFITPEAPDRGSRLLINIFSPDEPKPMVASGVVATLRDDDQGRGQRVAIRFDRDLPCAFTAKLRMLGEPADMEEPAAVEAVPEAPAAPQQGGQTSPDG